MATRVSRTSATIIDHIVSNTNAELFRHVVINDMHLSDHRYIFMQLNHVSRANIVSNSFSLIDFRFVGSQLNGFSTDEFDKFHGDILECIKRNTVSISVGIKKRPNSTKPWFDRDLELIAKKREKYFKYYVRYRENKFIHDRFIYYKTLFSKSIKIKKRLFYNNKLAEVSSEPKKFWNTISEIIHNKTTGSNRGISLTISNEEVSDPIKLTEIFNSYFISIGSQSVNSSSSAVPCIVNRNNNFSLNAFEPTTVEEIGKIILNLKNSSAGYDSIKAGFLTNGLNFFSELLSGMINDSFITGNFPSSLKKEIRWIFLTTVQFL
jgi:hypothetical protein